MSTIWSAVQMLFLASVALTIALLFASEMIELKRRPRPLRPPSDAERARQAVRHLPRASRQSWHERRLAAEAVRRIAPD